MQGSSKHYTLNIAFLTNSRGWVWAGVRAPVLSCRRPGHPRFYCNLNQGFSKGTDALLCTQPTGTESGLGGARLFAR